uniref:Uncharacterized protein n=1 Tax=Scleropages formosus TaxID=113540 RepID=A0A8C9RCZ8_SCLFO
MGSSDRFAKYEVYDNNKATTRPMDQGAIATFKAYYLRSTFVQAIAAATNKVLLCDFWKCYNILELSKDSPGMINKFRKF